MQHIVDRNQEVLNNFIKAIEELAILRDNLLKKEVCHIFQMFRCFSRFPCNAITVYFNLLLSITVFLFIVV